MNARSHPNVSGSEIPSVTLFELIQQQAQARPDADAIIAPGQPTLSSSSLVDRIQATRRFLAQHGLGRGDKIGVMIRSRDVMAVTHLSVQSFATSVPINPQLTSSELTTVAGDFDLAALITDETDSEAVTVASNETGVPVFAVAGSRSAGIGRFELQGKPVGPPKLIEVPDENDIATLLYTSGSTANPKIVPQSHGNRTAAAISACSFLKISETDRCLNMMPLYHTAGLQQELAAELVSGAAVILAEFDPPSIADLLREYRPTLFNLTPQMYALALPHLRAAALRPGEVPLRFIRSGSALMSEELKAELEQIFRVPLVNAYGSTETSFLAMTELPPGEVRYGSVGRAHSGVRVVDESAEPLGPAEIGEIWAKGPAVVTEYYGDPEATSKRFIDGWYRTGDTGYLDTDGFLYMTGRLSDVINRGGEKISPAEVEKVLGACEGIQAVGVFGANHPDLGQEVHAACVLSMESTLTPAMIRTFAAQRMTWSKVPKQVHTLDRLPTSGTGKLMRSKLVELCTVDSQ